jgi:hypothetical protein
MTIHNFFIAFLFYERQSSLQLAIYQSPSLGIIVPFLLQIAIIQQKNAIFEDYLLQNEKRNTQN